MLTHIIVPASSTIGEFFDGIFPDAGCLLNRLVECRTSNSESRDVLGWDVTWEELEPPRYVIFQPLDQISAYFLERDGKEFFPNTPASSDVPEGHLAVRVLVENDPCLLARFQMLEDRVLVLERAAARRLNPEGDEGNDIGEERNEGRKQQRRFMGIFVTGPSAHKLLYLVDTHILGTWTDLDEDFLCKLQLFLLCLPYVDIFHLSVSGGTVLHDSDIPTLVEYECPTDNGARPVTDKHDSLGERDVSQESGVTCWSISHEMSLPS